jgi:hypothetical protein
MAGAPEKCEAGGSAVSEPSLDDLLRSLNIRGEDIGGVFVPKEEVETLREEKKWMAVMRLLSPKPFSAASLKKTMRFAWLWHRRCRLGTSKTTDLSSRQIAWEIGKGLPSGVLEFFVTIGVCICLVLYLLVRLYI